MNPAQRLVEDARSVIGTHCWSVVAGTGTGSAIDLAFGKQVRRGRPLTNPTLSGVEREYRGEYGIFVTCSWRVDEDEAVVLSWQSQDEPRYTKLKTLVGSAVTGITLVPPAMDLCVEFSSLKLRIFCDQQEDDNYSLHLPNRVYVVGPMSQVSIE